MHENRKQRRSRTDRRQQWSKNFRFPAWFMSAIVPTIVVSAHAQSAQEQQDGPGKDVLEEVTVFGRDFRGEAIASSATKFDMPVIETPQSIKAITADIKDLANIQMFEDVYKVDASTSSEGTAGAIGQGFTRAVFRGFPLDSLNGFKEDGFDALPGEPGFNYAALDLAHVERFELVKGPTSLLYGQNQVGGTINAISKKPQAEAEHIAILQAGSNEFYRLELDSTGPITSDGRLTYRAIGAYQDAGSFVDFVTDDLWVVAPSLQFDATEDTSILLSLNHQERSFTPTIGSAAFGAAGDYRIPNIPIERNLSQPWNHTETELTRARMVVTHSLHNDMQLRATGQYVRVNREQLVGDIFGLVEPDGDVDNFVYLFDADAEVWNGEVSLAGDFELFGRSHQFFVSADHRQRRLFQNFSFLVPEQRQNVFNPIYNVPQPSRDPADFNYFYIDEDDEMFWGGTVQVMLNPTERISILAGGRYDYQDSTNYNFVSEASDSRSLDKFVPQVGVTFHLTKDTHLYLNYGETFVPQLGRQADGTPEGRRIDPEEGEQIEGGIKSNILGGNMTATLALFELKRTGIRGQDPNNPSFLIPFGTQRSRGVELDVYGSLLSNWEIYASTAYLDAEFTESDVPERIGSRPPNTSKWAGSIFTSYAFPSGPLAGLGVAGGIVYKGPRKGGIVGSVAELDLTSPQIDTGDVTLVDVRVFYDFGPQTSVSLTVSNLLNEQYYYTCSSTLTFCVLPAEPRQYLAQLRYKF